MSHIYHDDEWRWAQPAATLDTTSRHAEQCRIDGLYGTGQISVEEWRQRFDELSDPLLWSSEGRIAA